MVVTERTLGCQEPSLEVVPDGRAARRSNRLLRDALELGESCGLTADPWQKRVLSSMLALDSTGGFAAFKIGLNVPRQNGKGSIIELRELAGVVLLGQREITHSAQQMDTSLDHMMRLTEALEQGGLSHTIKSVMTGNGREKILFKSGQIIRFRTRSRTGGRGLAADLVVFDEAMFIADYMHNALVPTLTTRPQAQIVYAGSAADQEVHANAVVWARLREAALAGGEGRMAYHEWSAPYSSVDEVPNELDMEAVAVANPALGIRITEQYIRDEWGTLDRRGRAVERYGVGDWPATFEQANTVMDMAAWAQVIDMDSTLDGGEFCFAFDVSPQRTGSVAVAGRRTDGRFHVEIMQAKNGTSWLPAWLAAKVREHEPYEVVCSATGPVASILNDVLDAGVVVRTVPVAEHASACGKFVDLVGEQQVRHRDQPALTGALRGAATRPFDDAWLWSRKNSTVDISPLVAATLALDAADRMPTGGFGTIY